MDMQYVIQELKKQANTAKEENIRHREQYIKDEPDQPIPYYLQDQLSLPEILSSICQMLVQIDEKLHK